MTNTQSNSRSLYQHR